MILFGSSKIEIKWSGTGFGMMGYGRDFNIIKGTLSPLYVRACCFADPNSSHRVFYLNAEICLILPELKRELLHRLHNHHPDANYTDENIMITAQHTHSAPGGYSHYPFYNWSIPGYRPDIFEAYVHSFYEAVVESEKNMQPAVLSFGSGDFKPDEDVAFQRSLKAYNANPGVQTLDESRTHLAIERTMYLLKVESPEGRLLGQLNWFGVHTTSLGNRVHLVSSDNKGYASEYLEKDMPEGGVAIFAQQFAGDVSPNFHGKGKDWPKGKFKDDIKSAEFNGELQYRKAKQILNQLQSEHRMNSYILDAEVIYKDFSNLTIDEEFNQGDPEACTTPACHGLGFLKGTPVDGRGMPHGIIELALSISKSLRSAELAMAKVYDEKRRRAIELKYKSQDPKVILMEPGEGKILGTTDIKNLVLPGFIDGGIMEMKHEHRKGAMKELPWTPAVLPLHFMRIGDLAIIGFPGEITTVAGQQLRALIQEILNETGIKHVVISSYANSYMGYCTTYHEYHEQCYEGGHTVFGKWTFDAFRSEYKKFMREVLKPKQERIFPPSPRPKVFSKEELALRTSKDFSENKKKGKKKS
jgi:neutral ceramidase